MTSADTLTEASADTSTEISAGTSADKITGLVDQTIEEAEPLVEKAQDNSGKDSTS